MSPEHLKSFVTYYLQNLSERTRREKAGTKWGIDWVAYNIGLARFGKPVRLPFLRHGADGYPKSKVEAEFGIDVAFVSEDGSALVIFVLKDEPLTNRTWTGNDFDRDLRMAMTPDLSAGEVRAVRRVTIILAYNKDDQQNGVTAYDRFVAAAPKQIADGIALEFLRWNLSELVEQTIQHVMSPALVPERFFGQLTYLAAQIADFRHGSDKWEQQLIPNWKRFLDDVLSETVGTRGPEFIPVALIILGHHAAANPSRETGWIDLIEWAVIALWRSVLQRQDPEFRDAVVRFWTDFYIVEIERFYRAHIDALSVEHSIDQLANATSVGTVAASEIAYWHVARIGLLSFDASTQRLESATREDRLHIAASWFAALVNANESVLRPILDIEHIQLFLMFETLRNANRLDEASAVFSTLETKLYLRRVSKATLPFLDGRNSLDNVFEHVATRPEESLVTDQSSYFVMAFLEMCCAFEPQVRDDLLRRSHRHLVLGAVDVGEPGDTTALDLVSWIPPQNWLESVLTGTRSVGEGVAINRLADDREASGEQVFTAVRRAVEQMRAVDPFQLPADVPAAVLVLASMRHRMPLPPELWRRVAFPVPTNAATTAGI